MRHFASLSLLLLVCPPALPAATDPAELAPFGVAIDVPLVELEVVVTGPGGAAVGGLAAGDFKVFEDDVAVTIEHFERVDGARRPGRDEGEGAGARGLSLAIFLDDVHVGAASRRRLLEEFVAALEQRLRPDDRVMLATYDGNVHIALPFSRDRKALRAALIAAQGPSLARLAAESERTSALQHMSMDAAGQMGWSPCLHMQEFVDYQAQAEYQRVTAAVSAFGAFIDSMSAVPGRKAVLHVSDGIPMRAGAEAAEHAYDLCAGPGAVQGRPNAIDQTALGPENFGAEFRRTEANRYDMTGRWEQVAARANAGNVSIYTFQAGASQLHGVSAAESIDMTVSPATASRQQVNLQETLFRLAEQTGGRASLSGFAASKEVDVALAELRSYYLVAYTPPRAGEPGVRRLRVSVDRPGVEVRHRKLYAPRTTHERVADQLLAHLLYEDVPAFAGDSPVLEMVEHQRSGESSVKARFRLRVPLADLARIPAGTADASERALFAVFVAATDGKGGSSGVRQSLVPVVLASGGDGPVREFLWEVEMVLRPGRQRVGVAVRDELGGETFYVVRDFDLRRG